MLKFIISLTWFLILTFLVKIGATGNFDLVIGHFVQSFVFLRQFSDIFMYSGWGPWLYFWTGGIFLALVAVKRYLEAGFFILIYGIDTLAFFSLVHLINRPRPTSAQLFVVFPLPLGGYPSGHVLLVSMVFLFLIYVIRRPWIVALGTIIMALTGVARIYSGQHFATDIFGAYLLAYVLIIPIIRLYRYINNIVGVQKNGISSRRQVSSSGRNEVS